jgi:uncharacterized SAM-binding protein YcdF (DUF218 family)
MKRVLEVVAALVVAFILLVGYLAFRVWDQSHHDQTHSADAIVVLGAAQYNVVPSPVLKARLDHATYLYRQGLSKTIITTGGSRPGDNYTEAQAEALYLEKTSNVSPQAILQVGGDTTLETLRRVQTLAHGHDITSLLLVSDPLHSERLQLISHDLGFKEAYTSPDSYLDLHRSRLTKAGELVHEVGSLLAYEFFQRWRH